MAGREEDAASVYGYTVYTTSKQPGGTPCAALPSATWNRGARAASARGLERSAREDAWADTSSKNPLPPPIPRGILLKLPSFAPAPSEPPQPNVTLPSPTRMPAVGVVVVAEEVGVRWRRLRARRARAAPLLLPLAAARAGAAAAREPLAAEDRAARELSSMGRAAVVEQAIEAIGALKEDDVDGNG